MRADNCGDSRRARNAEVSQRVRELVLHAATSSRERAPTDAEMSSTQRRDRHQRRQRQMCIRDSPKVFCRFLSNRLEFLTWNFTGSLTETFYI